MVKSFVTEWIHWIPKLKRYINCILTSNLVSLSSTLILFIIFNLLTFSTKDYFHLYHLGLIIFLCIQVVRFISKVTLLASGGAGHIYPTTTNPPVFQAPSLRYLLICWILLCVFVYLLSHITPYVSNAILKDNCDMSSDLSFI